MDNQKVPPAVGEFALQERAHLKATIAEHAREIERRIEFSQALARDAAKLDDEIARLKAALKAQPSGVVQADDIRAACQNAVEVFAEEPNAAQCREVAEYMREVLLAALNSSPVSAGEPAKCSYQDDPRSPSELSLAGCNCVRFGEGNPHWPCKLHPAHRAGGLDERASLEKRTHDILIRCLNHPHTFRHQIVSDDELCDVIEARAALTASAPNHSEQVRHMVPNGYVLVPERMHLDANVIEAINYHCGDGQEDAGYGTHVDGLLWIGFVEDDDGVKSYGLNIATAEYPEKGSTQLVEFAAAPSAGSQGGAE